MACVFFFTCLVLLASCGHDSRRGNPLDPELTPAAGLHAAIDGDAGSVALSWDRYAGRARFGAYWVLRNEADRIPVDTLSVLTSPAQTTWIDTGPAPNTPYVYRVSVVNTAGLERTSAPVAVAAFRVGPVTLLGTEVDPRQGHVTVRWSRFDGMRFEAYRVERRQVGREERSTDVARLVDVADTVFVDTTLAPGTEYIYRVVLEAAGSQWLSADSGREGFVPEAVRIIRTVPDSTTGVVHLAWTAYSGPGFVSYEVRRTFDDGSETVVHLTTDVQDTSLVDSTALAGLHSYTVAVVTAGRTLLSLPATARLTLPTVELTQISSQAARATASLTWTPYSGPFFVAYLVERREPGISPRILARLEDPAQVTWRDSQLVGGIEYSYRILVLTTRGERLAGPERHTSFHDVVDWWPLPSQPGQFVRLYTDPGTGISALMASESTIRLLRFTKDGRLVDEQALWSSRFPLLPRSAATALTADGGRILSVAYARGPRMVLRFDRSGDLRLRDVTLLPDVAGMDMGRQIAGQIRVSGLEVVLDRVAVTAESRVVLVDDFEADRSDLWQSYLGSRQDGMLYPTSRAIYLGAVDTTWQDVGLVVEGHDLEPNGGLTLRLGSVSKRGFAVLRVAPEQIVIAARSGATASVRRDTTRVLVTPGAFRVQLAIEGGRLRIGFSQPWMVSASRGGDDGFMALAQLEDRIALADGRVPYTSGPGEATRSLPATDAEMSELRIWRTQMGQRSDHWLGACLPARHRVLFNRTAIRSRVDMVEWSLDYGTSRRLGPSPGGQPGHFVFPLSLAGSADGRVYVLDAGNSRIQVFDRDGNYITRWGRPGTGLGAFDFGTGNFPTSGTVVGSIAVDDEGFIYVADVGNGRIQRFAP